MPTPQELGNQAALSLLREIHAPEKIYSQTHMDKISARTVTDNYDQLMDEVPNRGAGPNDVGFYSHTENKKTKYPTKEAVFGKMSKDSFVAFCCASLEANVVAAFDIDHVFPFARIKQKQVALLAYLNDPANKTFANAFLATTDPAKGNINKYFRKSELPPKGDGKIKGTKRFFYDCYNDVGNLLPITHHINREKSDSSTAEWFKGFPEPLKKELEVKGGIHEGIIIEKVFVKSEDVCEFQIGDVTKAMKAHIHQGKGVGLGDFVADWFNKRPSIKEDATQVLELKQKLTSMIEEGLKEESQEITFKKIFKKINTSLQIMKQHYDTISNPSSGDSSDAEDAQKIITTDEVLRGITYMHKAKQAKKIAKERFHDATQLDVFKKNFYQMGIRAGILRLPTPQDIDKAMDVVLAELAHRGSITTEDMLKIFETAETAANPVKQQLIASKVETEEERAARVKTEAELQIELLKRQIAEAKGQVAEAKGQAEQKNGETSVLALASSNLYTRMLESEQYDKETLKQVKLEVEKASNASAIASNKTESIRQETDLQKIKDALTEIDKQRKIVDDIYKSISTISPKSVITSYATDGSTLSERVVGKKDSRKEPAEALKGANTEGGSRPPRPNSQ